MWWGQRGWVPEGEDDLSLFQIPDRSSSPTGDDQALAVRRECRPSEETHAPGKPSDFLSGGHMLDSNGLHLAAHKIKGNRPGCAKADRPPVGAADDLPAAHCAELDFISLG